MEISCSLDSIDVPCGDDLVRRLYRIFTTVRSPHKSAKKIPLDFIICLDASGSMDMPGKMSVIKVALCNILVPKLTPADRIGVVVFSDTARILLPLTAVGAENAEYVKGRIRAITTYQQTNFLYGLNYVGVLCGDLGAPRGAQRVVLFFSDGWDSFIDDDVTPQQREQRVTQILRQVVALRATFGIELHAYGLCSDDADDRGVDADVLRRMAEAGRGEFSVLTTDNMCRRLKRFFGKITACVATHVTVSLSCDERVLRVVRLYPQPATGAPTLELGSMNVGERRDVGALFEFAGAAPIDPGVRVFSAKGATVSVRVCWLDTTGAPRRADETVAVVRDLRYPVAPANAVGAVRCDAAAALVREAERLQHAIEQRRPELTAQALDAVCSALKRLRETVAAGISAEPVGAVLAKFVGELLEAALRAKNGNDFDAEKLVGALMSAASDLLTQRSFQKQYQQLPTKTEHGVFASNEVRRAAGAGLSQFIGKRMAEEREGNERSARLAQLLNDREKEYVHGMEEIKRAVVQRLERIRQGSTDPHGMTAYKLRALLDSTAATLSDINAARRRGHMAAFAPPAGLSLSDVEPGLRYIEKSEHDAKRKRLSSLRVALDGGSDAGRGDEKKGELLAQARRLCDQLGRLNTAAGSCIELPPLSERFLESATSLVKEGNGVLEAAAQHAKAKRADDLTNEELLASLELDDLDEQLFVTQCAARRIRAQQALYREAREGAPALSAGHSVSDEECRAVFERLDDDKDGYLSVRQLWFALEALELTEAARRVERAVKPTALTAEGKLARIVASQGSGDAGAPAKVDGARVSFERFADIVRAQSRMSIQDCFAAVSHGRGVLTAADLAAAGLSESLVEFVESEFPRTRRNGVTGYDYAAWLAKGEHKTAKCSMPCAASFPGGGTDEIMRRLMQLRQN